MSRFSGLRTEIGLFSEARTVLFAVSRSRPMATFRSPRIMTAIAKRMRRCSDRSTRFGSSNSSEADRGSNRSDRMRTSRSRPILTAMADPTLPFIARVLDNGGSIDLRPGSPSTHSERQPISRLPEIIRRTERPTLRSGGLRMASDSFFEAKTRRFTPSRSARPATLRFRATMTVMAEPVRPCFGLLRQRGT